jgi:hypothetical protein
MKDNEQGKSSQRYSQGCGEQCPQQLFLRELNWGLGI